MADLGIGSRYAVNLQVKEEKMEILRFLVSLPNHVFLLVIPLAFTLLVVLLRPLIKWVTWEIPDVPNKLRRLKNRKMIAEIRRTSTHDPRTFVSLARD